MTNATWPEPALGRLDASWRGDYIDRATADERMLVATGNEPTTGESCVFCAMFEQASSTDSEDAQVVIRGRTANVVLNRYPYSSGHLLVLPARHVADLESLSAPERSELFELVSRASAALRRAYLPDGMNVGINIGRAGGAGLPGHLHAHVVPRWSGDTNFMTVIGEARVVPEALGVSLLRVRAAWDEL